MSSVNGFVWINIDAMGKEKEEDGVGDGVREGMGQRHEMITKASLQQDCSNMTCLGLSVQVTHC